MKNGILETTRRTLEHELLIPVRATFVVSIVMLLMSGFNFELSAMSIHSPEWLLTCWFFSTLLSLLFIYVRVIVCFHSLGGSDADVSDEAMSFAMGMGFITGVPIVGFLINPSGSSIGISIFALIPLCILVIADFVMLLHGRVSMYKLNGKSVALVVLCTAGSFLTLFGGIWLLMRMGTVASGVSAAFAAFPLALVPVVCIGIVAAVLLLAYRLKTRKERGTRQTTPDGVL